MIFSLIISILTILVPIIYLIYVKRNKNVVDNMMDYKYNFKCLGCEQKFDIFDSKTGNIRINNYPDHFLCDDCVKENNRFERSSKLNLLISNSLGTRITNFFSKFKFKLRKFFIGKRDFKLLVGILIFSILGHLIYFILLFGFKIRLDFLLDISRLSLVFYWISKVVELFIFK